MYTSLPDWAQSLGTVFSIMLIAPSWGGVLNGLLTLLGAWDRVRQLSGWIGRKGIKAVRMIGIFNGLIPCGLVYMAIAGAVTSGHILSGAAFMRLFGPGTVPLMAFTGLADQSLNPARRSRLRRFAPALMLLIAALFRLRGLQSEVPDPLRFWEEVRNIPMCR